MTSPFKSLQGLRILVAEDETMIAFDLENSLAHFGCKVVGPASRIDEVVQAAGQPAGREGANSAVPLRS